MRAPRAIKAILNELEEALIERCPVCGARPDIDECDIPGTGWYASCYKPGHTPSEEHFVGVNANCRAEVIACWNAHVRALTPNGFRLPNPWEGPRHQAVARTYLRYRNAVMVACKVNDEVDDISDDALLARLKKLGETPNG